MFADKRDQRLSTYQHKMYPVIQGSQGVLFQFHHKLNHPPSSSQAQQLGFQLKQDLLVQIFFQVQRADCVSGFETKFDIR